MKNIKEKILQNEFFKGSLIVIILTFFSSGINYICQIFMGRIFNVSNYGIINTFLSLYLIISVVGNTSSMVLTKILSQKSRYKSPMIKYINKITFIIMIFFLLFFIVMNNLLKTLTNLSDYFLLLLLIVALCSTIYQVYYQGIFSGLKKFLLLGIYNCITPVSKLIILVIIKILNFNGNIQLILFFISIIFSNFICILIGCLYSKKIKINISKYNNNKILLKNYMNILVVNVFLALLSNIDVLYLSFFKGVESSGLYSSSLMFGRIVYYIVTAIVTVMLPFISSGKKNEKKLLFQTILFTGLLVVFFLIPINIFAKYFLNMLFGNKYLQAIPYIKYSSLISLAYSLNMIIVNYYFGISKLIIIKYSLIIGFLLIIIVLLFINFNEFLSLFIIGIVNLLVFMVNLIYLRRK